MTTSLTFEFFMTVAAGLLLVCGLFTYYLVDKLYTKAVCLYVASYELIEAMRKGEITVKVKVTETEHEPDDK